MALFLALFPSLCRRVPLLSRCAWVNRVQGGRISLLCLSMPASLTQSCFVLRPHLVQSRYRAHHACASRCVCCTFRLQSRDAVVIKRAVWGCAGVLHHTSLRINKLKHPSGQAGGLVLLFSSLREVANQNFSFSFLG